MSVKHDDDFALIGELLPMVIPAAKDIRPRRKPKAVTKAQVDLLNATAVHHAQEYGSEELAYMPSQLVQCTFPHDNPGTVPAWSRSTPWLTVTFQPGYRTDPKTRQLECIGYPYGTVPRLLMFYVMTEAERLKNRQELTDEQRRTIYLGSSLNKFMLNIGLNPDNGAGKRSDKKRLKNQVERFMRVRINFDQPHSHHYPDKAGWNACGGVHPRHGHYGRRAPEIEGRSRVRLKCRLQGRRSRCRWF